jgi:hypothetical protein
MRQTALEYLEQRLRYIKWLRDTEEISSRSAIDMCIQEIQLAKEMEREQILNAFDVAYWDGWNSAYYDEDPDYNNSQEYFNETFDRQ